MVGASCYFENGVCHFSVVKKLLKDIVNNRLGKNSLSVMDVGCGSGRLLLENVVPLLSKNLSELVGVDKHQSMIEHCRILNADPKISFEQLDITTKDLPKKFIGKFDIITSFFCLHYARDYEQTIQNMRKMLKPNGELIYIQAYNLNPLYECYRELCKNYEWKHLLQDFENYTAPFSESDRETKLEDIYRRNGLKLLKYTFAGIKFQLTPKKFVASLQALDTYGKTISGDQEEAFISDLHKSLCKVLNFDDTNEEYFENETEITYDCLTVHAKKPVTSM